MIKTYFILFFCFSANLVFSQLTPLYNDKDTGVSNGDTVSVTETFQAHSSFKNEVCFNPLNLTQEGLGFALYNERSFENFKLNLSALANYPNTDYENFYLSNITFISSKSLFKTVFRKNKQVQIGKKSHYTYYAINHPVPTGVDLMFNVGLDYFQTSNGGFYKASSGDGLYVSPFNYVFGLTLEFFTKMTLNVNDKNIRQFSRLRLHLNAIKSFKYSSIGNGLPDDEILKTGYSYGISYTPEIIKDKVLFVCGLSIKRKPQLNYSNGYYMDYGGVFIGTSIILN